MGDHTIDVLVIGTGAAGMVGALTAHERGLEVLVVEKADRIGGTTAWSGGGMWIPDNHVSRAAGVEDSREAALTYLDEVIGEAGPASTPERREAFVDQGPRMVAFLERLGFRWMASLGYPDYYPEAPGSSIQGRCIEGETFDLTRLGDWQHLLNLNPNLPPVPIHSNEASKVALATRTLKGLRTAATAIGGRMLLGRLLGRVNAGMGASLVGQLMYLARQRDLPIWLRSPLVELWVEDGRVVGAVVERDGERLRIRARQGVLVATGGFAHNLRMRKKYQPEPSSTEWTSTPPTDTGDGIEAGMEVGAAVALMDDAWYGPTLVDPESGTPSFILWERSFPHGIIVDSTGARFMNESGSYIDAGHAMYARHHALGDRGQAIPAWLILDAHHRRRYPLGLLPPGITPRSALRSGFLTRARSLRELAEAIGVDPEGLQATVHRFNGMARSGIDRDFHRGDNDYDRFYSDPRNQPNPNLGVIDKAPFYAVKVWPGDLGTKGGLLTDHQARVLREDGGVIAGLYASGNATASVMGRTYPGPGSTLGPAATFAWIAANHMADQAEAVGRQERTAGGEPQKT